MCSPPTSQPGPRTRWQPPNARSPSPPAKNRPRPPPGKTIRSWDVIGLADQAITPEQQLNMAHRANAQITEIPDASHVSMISHPDAVTRVIEQAAAAAG